MPKCWPGSPGYWVADTGYVYLALRYNHGIHISVIHISEVFTFDGRSGPRLLNALIPKSPDADGRAALVHDLCGQGVGLSKRECDCLYATLIKDYTRLNVGLISRVLDVVPGWYTYASDLWFANDHGLTKYTFWIKAF